MLEEVAEFAKKYRHEDAEQVGIAKRRLCLARPADPVIAPVETERHAARTRRREKIHGRKISESLGCALLTKAG
ncbi:hypothetical protein SCH01S_28_00840 [Sphingomonas changbaiensis NBRC 104936]|uniref:Uncharacterized protein n=1 Tax=Sphingomonas changbaiensis NBRC 104936 TaxID=1219043 RepID=A0A0E9MQ16_9SPHN|nr:hypothetical protein SCH01S_28_00840 [Sphingomonas changbaiensis NBRC 104936]